MGVAYWDFLHISHAARVRARVALSHRVIVENVACIVFVSMLLFYAQLWTSL